jgi:hypothetical protein
MLPIYLRARLIAQRGYNYRVNVLERILQFRVSNQNKMANAQQLENLFSHRNENSRIGLFIGHSRHVTLLYKPSD